MRMWQWPEGGAKGQSMKVTHIGHSGFLIELDTAILLFDYYRGELPPMNPDKQVYIFSSHVHADHFHMRIFSIAPGAVYILSNDIHKKYNRRYFEKKGVPEEIYERITFVKAHEELRIGGLYIRTLDSTDQGVAFLVEACGKTIYHAGDLNWWSWEGETEENERRMEQKFKGEIARLAGIPVDVACMTLDGRQGERFFWGFDYFMRNTDVKLVYPMHYWEEPQVIERLIGMEISEPYRERIVRL